MSGLIVLLSRECDGFASRLICAVKQSLKAVQSPSLKHLVRKRDLSLWSLQLQGLRDSGV